jgi:uncharacterized membrane protein
MLTPDQIDLETEVREFSKDDALMGFFRDNEIFLGIYDILKNFDSSSYIDLNQLLVTVLRNSGRFIDLITTKLNEENEENEENKNNKNIVRKFSLLCFYCYFQDVKKCSKFELFESFQGYEQIFNSFFRQNPNELEKLIMYAIYTQLFKCVPSILRIFSETGNIQTLALGTNRFLEAFNENAFQLLFTEQSLAVMQHLRTLLYESAYREIYSETLRKLDSFLAKQKQLRLGLSPKANRDSFSYRQIQLEVTQTPVVYEQSNFWQNTENQSWIKQHRLKIALGVALFGVVLALVIPAALIFAGIIASTPTIGFVLIGIAAAVSLVASIVYAIIKYRNSKEPEKQTTIADLNQPITNVRLA